MHESKKKGIETLNMAFDSFNKVSVKLVDSYETLKKKVEELKLEISFKDIEIEKLKEKTVRQDRLAAMGELAAKMAHEVRNPLGSMELFSSILKKEVFGNKKSERLVDHIQHGIRNIDNVVSNMLIFTKSKKPKKVHFDLNVFLDELLNFTGNVINQHDINLEKFFDSETLTCFGDIELLKQVFLNVILNAIQAMNNGGVLTVKTIKNRLKNQSLLSERKFITVAISDTGDGISDDIKRRIFDPFFSTKDMGTGLGLTIADNIINSHDGSIDVLDNKDLGVTFFVNLPAN